MQHLYVVCEEGANYLKYIYIYIYIYTNIHSTDLLVCPKKTECGTSQLHTNMSFLQHNILQTFYKTVL
jgi:hypothetical protein